jgi:hypothetical protein
VFSQTTDAFVPPVEWVTAVVVALEGPAGEWLKVVLLKAKKSSHEVLGGLRHTVLSRGSSGDLSGCVVQLTIVVTKSNAAVEQLFMAYRNKDFSSELNVRLLRKESVPMKLTVPLATKSRQRIAQRHWWLRTEIRGDATH